MRFDMHIDYRLGKEAILCAIMDFNTISFDRETGELIINTEIHGQLTRVKVFERLKMILYLYGHTKVDYFTEDFNDDELQAGNKILSELFPEFA